MPRSPVVRVGRAALLDEFRWDTGHADIWRVFTNAAALTAVVAVNLGVGFQAVRKTDGMLPGQKLSVLSAPDYRGRQHQLRMQHVLGSDDVTLLVDDWAEHGSQAPAVHELIEMSGARFAGASVLVDQLEDDIRAALGRVTSLVRATELGDPDDSMASSQGDPTSPTGNSSS